MEAMNMMKLGKATGPSNKYMFLIIASGKFDAGVKRNLVRECLMGKVCQKDGKQVSLFQFLKEKGM